MTDTLRPYISLQSIQEEDADYSSRVIHDTHGTRFPYKIELIPGSLVFGNVEIGSFSAKQTVTVRNAGYLPLAILNVIAVGDSFAVSHSACPILIPDEKFEIVVEFSPHGLGLNTGGIFIDVGEAIGKNFIQFSGNGVVTGNTPSDSIPKIVFSVDGDVIS